MYFEEPCLLPLCIRKLSLTGNPIWDKNPYEICESINQSRLIEKERSEAFKRSVGSLINLKEFSIRQDLFLESFGDLASMPLERLEFDEIAIDQEGIHTLSTLTRNCSSLRSITVTVYEESTYYKLSTIFSAVLENTSIRFFSIRSRSPGLQDEEIDSLAQMITQSKTLRHVHLGLVSTKAMIAVLQALSKNTSIQVFASVGKPAPQCATWLKVVHPDLDVALLEVIRKNTALRDLTFEIGGYDPDVTFSRDTVCAGHQSPTLDRLIIYGSKSVHRIKCKERSDEEKADFANRMECQAKCVVKIGRLMSGSRLICGRVVPVELIEAIMRHVTSECLWDDAIWKVIRRTVLNRNTIGQIMSGPRAEFDAYELLYRCRSLL